MEFRYIDYRTEHIIPKEKYFLYLEEKATINRINLFSAIAEAQSGHPGGSLSAADILTALYSYKEKEDRFVLSAGHKAPIYYATLAAEGYFETSKLRELRKIGGLDGHPSPMAGVQVPTGSLGQGLSMANGIALALRIKKENSKVYVLLGDGELQEGQIWEAAMFASHYKLSNVIAMVDQNGLQIDGSNDDVMKVYPIKKKFESFGWNVIGEDIQWSERNENMYLNGHDMEAILRFFEIANESEKNNKPTAIIFNTTKGKGVKQLENKVESHGTPPNYVQYDEWIKELEKCLDAVRNKYVQQK